MQLLDHRDADIRRPTGFYASIAALLAWIVPPVSAIDYASDIQPVFDRYCVACHACFDAPCQLDLSQASGVERGASKSPVYDGARLDAAQPSRLGIDAVGVDEWRERGFFPVVGSPDRDSVLRRMLDALADRPWQTGQPLPASLDLGIGRTSTCPKPGEVDDVLQAQPHLGMPFALPAIPSADLARLHAWLDQGAPADDRPPRVSEVEATAVADWERWLNRPEPRVRLVARWLFEHWAIARLHFDAVPDGNFFRLVRSSTPPGEPVREIATRFPNSDPGGAFHYRLRPQSGTRVYKTHIRFALNDGVMRRIESLFLDAPWEAGRLPGYTAAERANPFITFAAIPVQARYRFMLENAGYFVRTFIRGPVCRGQLATDVIRDHFWVMFQAPASDPYIVDPDYRGQVDDLLALPGIDDDLLDGAEQWLIAAEDRNRYASLRQARLARLAHGGADLAAIWDGDGHDRDALLTVFRHHDSAAVRTGWWGQLPLTAWLMDYPLLERSYYNLVVNFDVFGNVSHQAQTRLYFDLIRNGAEQNFLRLLPAETRQDVLDSWYAGSGRLKLWLAYQEIDTETPTTIDFVGAEPKTELLNRLLSRFDAINAGQDALNRVGDRPVEGRQAAFARLAPARAQAMPAIRHLPEASLIWSPDAVDGGEVYTLLRNRRHSNVAFIHGESLRYEVDEDYLSVLPGVATAYPNLIFEVPVGDIDAFADALLSADNGDQAAFVEQVVERWALRRTAADFWQVFHAIGDWHRRTDPLEAGLLDLNRYVDYRR